MLDDEDRLNDDELAGWLAFDQMEGIGLGSSKILKIYNRMQSMKVAFEATPRQMREYGVELDDRQLALLDSKRPEIKPDKLLEKVRKANVTPLAFSDPRYPYFLKHIHDPPAVLYINGVPRHSDFQKGVGVVGTRRPTSYGHMLAKQVARDLSNYGVTVVSGMALGIDSFAHWGSLEGKGRTIAVMACGPDVCYPSSNKRLFKTILENDRGIIVSEYFPGTKPDTWRFPARNRIISGLSQGLVVVEGDEKSGSLITAKLAFEQSRQVFAFPGRVDAEMSRGPNKIIRNQQAQLVTCAADVLEGLDWVTAGIIRNIPTVVELYGREREVYELLSSEPVHFDVLCERTSIPAGEMSATLTMLELAGIAARHPGDWYSRVQVGYAGELPTMSGQE